MQKIFYSKSFQKALQRLIHSRRIKEKDFSRFIHLLENNPFAPSLKTHKVNSKNHGIAFSSRLDYELRIIWKINDQEELIIILLDIGGHSGSKSVY